MNVATTVLIALLFAIGIGAQASAQSAPSLRQMAERAYESGDLQACARIYDLELGKQIWSIPMTELAAAKCYAKLDRQDDAMRAIERAVLHPGFVVQHLDDLQSESVFASLRARHDWAKLSDRAAETTGKMAFTGSGLDIAYARKYPPRHPFPLGGNRTRQASLLVWVAPDGAPAQVEVETSTGLRALDRIAVETALRWKYIPAVSGHRTYGFPVRLPFVF